MKNYTIAEFKSFSHSINGVIELTNIETRQKIENFDQFEEMSEGNGDYTVLASESIEIDDATDWVTDEKVKSEIADFATIDIFKLILK